jgi:hypothetical protein
MVSIAKLVRLPDPHLLMSAIHRCILACAAALVCGLAPLPAAAQHPTAPHLNGPPQEAVDAAIRAPLTRHNRNISGGAHTNMGHRDEAPVILAAAAHAGNLSADDRLLEQMRYTLAGGNDITANGGYPAQHDRYVAVMFAVARLTPRIWDQLTPRERHAADLLMTASFVSNAFTTSDHNPFVLARSQQYALDGDDNLNRDWNPNYREGMVGGALVGVVYFGGPERAQAVLDSYQHATFVAELEKAGLANIHETFTWKATHPESSAPTGEMIERAIRDYRYKGLALGDYLEIYGALTADTYGRAVECGLDDGRGVPLADGSYAGRLLSGCEALPNIGKPGMLKELDSVDAGGPRSSTTYAYSGFSINLVNQYVLMAGGYWRNDPVTREAFALQRVGIPDLWYKIEHGYSNYSKGRAQGEVRGAAGRYGLEFSRPLWEAVVLPYLE